MTPSYRLHHLFQKYLRNECGQQELLELVQMLNGAGNDELDALLETLWENTNADAAPYRIDWETMLKEVKASEKSSFGVQPEKRYANRRVWPRIMAAACILALLFIGIRDYFHNPDRQLAYAERTIPIKKIEAVTLADGSRITLNAGSKLRYPEKFSGNTREVYLEGEALFDIAQQPGKPFIVHTGQLTTTVLGTSFNISAYPDDEKMQVTVLTGKVSVQENINKKMTTLLPNQKAIFNTKTAQLLSNNVANPEPETAWQQGRMSFDDAPLTEVAAQFYRQYGITLKLQSPRLANCRLSIVLNNDNIDSLLTTITTITNSSYKYQDNEIILYGTGCD